MLAASIVRARERMASRYRVVGLVAVGLLAQNMGCGGPRAPSTESVSGTVTLKGQPLADAEVYFVSPQLVAYGKTDSAGHYALAQGAVAGENKVYFSKIEGGSSAFKAPEGLDDYQMQMAAGSGGGKKKVPKQLVPIEFANASAPKLNYLVPNGGSKTADFKL